MNDMENKIKPLCAANVTKVSAQSAAAQENWQAVWSGSNSYTSTGSFTVPGLVSGKDVRITATSEFDVYFYDPRDSSEASYTDTVTLTNEVLPKYADSNRGSIHFTQDGNEISFEFIPYQQEFKGFILVSVPTSVTITKVEQLAPPAVLEYGDMYLGFSEFGENPKFNIQNQRMLYVLPGLSIGDNSYKLSVSLVYDSEMKNGIVSLCKGMPTNWKLDAQQFLIADGTDGSGNAIYKYIDGAGYVHKFITFERDASRCYDEDGLGLVLTPSENKIEDMRGNTLVFSGGRLTERRQGGSEKATTVFAYDAAGKLTKMYDSRDMSATAPLHYIGFEYSGDILSEITAVYNGSVKKRLSCTYPNGKFIISRSASDNKTVEITYNAYGKVDMIADNETKTALKTRYSYNAYNPKILEISEGAISTSGEFIKKTSMQWNYIGVQTHDFTTACEAHITNEKGVRVVLQLNRHGRIIGTYQSNANRDAYQTLTPDVGVPVTATGTDIGLTINGVKVKSFTNALSLQSVDPRQTGEVGYRFYALNFHLMHSCAAERLRATLTCRLSDGSQTSKTVDVDPSAYDAWQQVSIPVDLGNSSNTISSMDLNLYVPGSSVAVKAKAGGFRIAAGTDRSVKLLDRFNTAIDFRDFSMFTITYGYLNGNLEPVKYAMENETNYITENDIIASATDMMSPRNAPACADFIMNNGYKRVSNMFIVSLGTGSNYVRFDSLYGSTDTKGYIIDTVSPDNRSRTRQTVSFGYDGIYVRTSVTVCKNKDKTLDNASDGDLLTGGETLRVTDYYGNVTKETDAYGVSKLYTYDGYGTLLTAKIIGSDGAEMVMQANAMDGSDRHMTSSHSATAGADMTYFEPFGLVDEVYAKERNLSTGAYVRNGAKTKFGYDPLYENITSVDDYDGSTKQKGISVTQSGNIMTVSDGASKYKVKENPAADTTEYLVCDSNGGETLAQDVTDDGYDVVTKYYRGNATDTVRARSDAYGKADYVQSDGKTAVYSYMSQTSGYAAVAAGVTDGFSGRVYEYRYDNAWNPCEWKIANKLDVKQISTTETEYVIENYRYINTIFYDASVTAEPRISTVLLKVDNNNSGKLIEAKWLGMNYEYDEFGRVKTKYSQQEDVSGLFPLYEVVNYGTENIKIPLIYGKTVKIGYDKGLNRRCAEMQETRTFHADGRLKNIARSVSASNASYASGYSESENYFYDKFGRLRSETNNGLGISRTYTYGGSRLYSITENGGTKYIQYDNRGRLSKITSDSAGNNIIKSFAYDNYGNRTSDNKQAYGWMRGNLMASAGSATYAYDYMGMRSKKIYGGTTTEYYYNGGKLLHESGAGAITYFYDIEGVNAARINGIYYTVVRDISGNIRYLVDGNKSIVAQYKYDAQGNCKVFDKNNSERTDSSFVGNVFPLRWKGFYYDRETGLYYANGRYYDPEIGQYLDASEMSASISEMYLDRNGIMCDNILELAPYMCSVLMNLSKDPYSTVDDGDSGWNLPWWGKLLIGLGFVLVGAVVTALTAGTGTGFVAAFGSALLSSTIQTGISVGLSASIGAVIGGVNNGWKGALDGAISGAVDGFMWGGIFAGSAQIVGSTFRAAANLGVQTGRKGGIMIGKTGIKVLSADKNNWAKAGGTLIKFGKYFRVDIGAHWGLHMHILSSGHLPIGLIIATVLSVFI